MRRRNRLLGAVGNPFFEDFMNPADAPTAKTHNLSSIIFKIREASLKADFQSKLDTSLIRMMGNAKTEEYFSGGSILYVGESQK